MNLPELKYLEAFIQYLLNRHFDPNRTMEEPKMPDLTEEFLMKMTQKTVK